MLPPEVWRLEAELNSPASNKTKSRVFTYGLRLLPNRLAGGNLVTKND